MNDLVADSLIRIKNSYLSFKPRTVLSYSKLVVAICQVLEKEGYILDYKEVKDEKSGTLRFVEVGLNYIVDENSLAGRLNTAGRKRAALTQVQRISKPGLRVYRGKNALPWVLNGQGIAIISTPKGVMTDKQARKEGLGGEVLAYVW